MSNLSIFLLGLGTGVLIMIAVVVFIFCIIFPEEKENNKLRKQKTKKLANELEKESTDWWKHGTKPFGDAW
jgi:preprotein translocase subunit YajC